MIDVNEVELVLGRMEELLHKGASQNWAKAIADCRSELPENPAITAAKIVAMYGGMGSFNDVVLYKDGQPLISENIEFDRLREKLFELCR